MSAPRPITETPNLWIPLPDGTRLAARVWMPEDATTNPVPAILEYLPYRKRDGTVARDALTHPWFAAQGYACLRVDIRGNGDSDGIMTDEYTEAELTDACDVIAWIAQQDWCSGSVGMMGISWGGFNGLQVAALQPPALKAIITLCSTVDRFGDDIHFKGGCLLGENLGWGATMLSYSSRPPDPALREDWRKVWLERLDAEPFLASVWLRHQRRDAYWRHGSVCEDFGAIKAATLAIGGWGDAYKNAVPALVRNLSAPVKGITGPWVHKYPHFAVPEPRIGFLQEATRWWDRWLKDAPTGVESDAAHSVYVLESEPPRASYAARKGRWLGLPNPAPVRTQRLMLGPDGLGQTGGTFARPVRSPCDCGLDAGEYCAIWLGPELPGDQRRDDALSACFDTAPLDAKPVIAGRPRVRLRLRSDKPVAQIAVRLNDVFPDGASARITYAVLNLCHRNGHDAPEPLVPENDVWVEIELDDIAYQPRAENRLRLAISTQYWPLIWPAPDAATVTILEGELLLPIVTEDVDTPEFPPPDAAPPWRHDELRPSTNTRRIERDVATGEVTLIIEDDFGKQRDLDHGLVSGGIGRETWRTHPDDPLCASAKTHWTQELSRGDWSIRTETRSSMWADETTFHLTASIEAYEGETRVFERHFTEQVPRDLM